jgi:hypothetical protein
MLLKIKKELGNIGVPISTILIKKIYTDSKKLKTIKT